MDKKIRTFSECKKIAAEQQFKHVRLLDLAGNVVCAYNPAHGKAMTLEKKFSEIERRLKNAEPGVYIIEYRARFSGREPTYKYYLGNKNFNPKQIENIPDVVEKAATPIAENKSSKADKLLSLETALEYATENARLTAENNSLTQEVRDLREENKKLNAELDAIDENPVSEESGMDKMASMGKSIAEILLPVLDRHIDLKEKTLNFHREKYLAENGFDIPGASKRDTGSDFNKKIPTPDDPNWENYIEWLESLSDRSFNKHLEIVKQASEDVYNAICEQMEITFEEEEEQMEEEKK